MCAGCSHCDEDHEYAEDHGMGSCCSGNESLALVSGKSPRGTGVRER
jgi:hypothetical protein